MIALTLLALMAAAQPPVIPDTLLARFWKANATMAQANTEIQTAQQHLQGARTDYSTIVKEMQDACGKNFQPQMDSKGDPACVAVVKK